MISNFLLNYMRICIFIFLIYFIFVVFPGGTLCVSQESINTIGQTLILNDKDEIYRKVKTLSIEHIGFFLQSKAVEAKLKYTSFKVILFLYSLHSDL